MLDGENSKKSKEVAELQAWVALEEQREEESRRESFGLKQRIVESEASRESARKEVGRALSWGCSSARLVLPGSNDRGSGSMVAWLLHI